MMDAKLGVKAVFLDLDGTIYLGGNLISASRIFIKMQEQGVQGYFLSNNSSRSVDQYVAKLHKMNIPCT